MMQVLQQIPVTAVQAALSTTAGGVATLSLPPHPATGQQQHIEVTGPPTATVVLTGEEVDKDKLDKGTCTTERCGENQVHCQVSINITLLQSGFKLNLMVHNEFSWNVNGPDFDDISSIFPCSRPRWSWGNVLPSRSKVCRFKPG